MPSIEIPQDKREYTKDSSLPLSKCKVGIEIEIENLAEVVLFSKIDGWWTRKTDGSLRFSGGEIITKPIFGKDIGKALKVFNDALIKGHLPPRHRIISSRTGVHIHIDFSNTSPEVIFRFLAVYLIIERGLFNFTGNREDNYYCAPLQETNSLATLGKAALHPQLFKMFLKGFNKYNALNLGALIKFGTIELRHLEGTLEHKKILEWIKVLLSIKRFAIKNRTVPLQEIIDRVCLDFEELFAEIIDPQIVPLNVFWPTIQTAFRDMVEGARFAQLFMAFND